MKDCQTVFRKWQLAVGSWQLAVGSWQLAVGSWQLAVGSWQLAVGSWQSVDCHAVFLRELAMWMVDHYRENGYID